MVPKLVLGAALLCFAQGLYISQTYISVIRELQPALNELKETVTQQIKETEKSIESINKYVDVKIEDARNTVGSKIKLLQEEMLEDMQVDKKIDGCSKNYMMAVDLESFNEIKDFSNSATFDKQVTELKGLSTEVSLISGTCVAQAKLDSAKTRSCIEEKLISAEEKSKKIAYYIDTNISRLRESLDKAVQVKVLEMFEIISTINSEFKACVEQSPKLTIEDVIDSKKEEINDLKQSIKAASSEWVEQISAAYKNIDAKVKAADIAINAQVSSLKIAGADTKLNGCISEHAEALNNLDKSELTECRVQSEIQRASNEVIHLPKLQASIGAAPGTCVEKVGSSAKQVQACIEEAIASTKEQLAAITERATSHYVTGMKSGAQCVKDAEAIIKNNIGLVILQFTGCVKENSAAVDEAITEFSGKMEIMKSNIRKTVEEWLNEIAEAYTTIKNAVDSSRKTVTSQISDLTVVIENKHKECVSEHHNGIKRLDTKALERCGISTVLENANMLVVQIAAFEGVIDETPSACRTEVGENVDKVKQCIADKFNRIHVDIQQFVSGLQSTVPEARQSNVNCVQYAHSNLVEGIQRVYQTFNMCLQEKSELLDKAVNEFTDKMVTTKTNIRNTVGEWNSKILESYKEIKKAVDAARSSVDDKIHSLNRVGLPQEAKVCVTKQQHGVSSLDKKSLERCQISNALESALLVVIEIAKYEAIIEETPSICSEEQDIKQCIADKLNRIHVDIHQYVAGLESTVSKATESQLQCAEYSEHKLVSSIDNILSEFNTCVSTTSSLLKETIDEFSEKMSTMKTNVRKTVEEWRIEIAESYKEIKTAVDSARSSINDEIASLTPAGLPKGTDECVSEQQNEVRRLDKKALERCQISATLENANIAVVEIAKFEDIIDETPYKCAENIEKIKQCIADKFNRIHVDIQQIVKGLQSSVSKAKESQLKCTEYVQSNLKSGIDNIASAMNVCINECSMTIEEVIDSFKDDLNKLKTSTRTVINRWNDQIASGLNSLQKIILKTSESIDIELSPLKLKLQEENDLIKSCVQQERVHINNLDHSELYSCSQKSGLSSASEYIAQLAKIEANIGGIVGICVKGNTVRKFKQCMENGLNEGFSVLKNLEEETRGAYTNGMQKGSLCISSSKKAITDKIQEIDTRYSTCIEETKIAAQLNEAKTNLKTIVKENVSNWAAQISAGTIYLQRTVADIVSNVNKQVNDLSNKFDDSNESVQACIHIEGQIKSLDQTQLLTCSKSVDLDIAAKQNDELAKVEVKIDTLTKNCVLPGQNIYGLKSCVESGLEEAESLVSDYTEGIKLAYSNAMRKASDCIVSNQEALFNQVDEISSNFDNCLEETKIAAQLNEAKTNLKIIVKENVSNWAAQISAGTIYLQRTVADIVSNVNKQVIDLSNKFDDSNESIQACIHIKGQIKSLDQTKLLTCSKSVDLDIAAKLNDALAKVEVKIDNLTKNCVLPGQNIYGLKSCVESGLEEAESLVSDYTEGIKVAYTNAMKKASDCIVSNQEALLNQVDEISSNFDNCLESKSYTEEELIADYNSRAEILKRKIGQATSYSKNQLDRISTIIQETRDEASNIIDTQLIKLSESVKYAATSDKNIESCLNQQETSIAKLGDGGINQCGQKQLQSLEEHINKLAYYVNVLSDGPTMCFRKQQSGSALNLISIQIISAKDLKICLDEILKQTESSAEAMTEEVRSIVQAAETASNNCINHAKSSAVQSVQGIISTFNFCVEESTSDLEYFKRLLEEVNTVARDASSKWSDKLESLKANIDKEVQVATSYINVKVEKLLEEKAEQCDTMIVINLDFRTLQSCTSSKHLETLSEKLDIFVRIESTVSASLGYCSGYKDVEACIEKAVANGQSQVEKLNSEISTLYILGSKAGTDCVHNAKQNMLNNIKTLSLTC